MQNYKVSVIIPAYNVAPFIVECLDSVYEQTYSNIELIVVNDGSTDETLAMLRDYRVEHGTMILIDQPNRGLSAARNAGLDIASGDFVFFLDSDDYIGADEIGSLVDAMADGVDMAVGGMTYVDESHNVLKTVCDSGRCLNEAGYWDRVYANEDGTSVEYIISCGKLYRAAIFDDVRFAQGKLHEDEFVIHQIVSRCREIRVVSCCQLFYVQNSKSITHRPSARALLDVAEAFLGRNRYFLKRGYIGLYWASLCQSKAALATASAVAKSNGDVARWKGLKKEWNASFAAGRGHFDIRKHNCVAFAAYRVFPWFFNKRAGRTA